jgi:PAS domain S-box-containing protein
VTPGTRTDGGTPADDERRRSGEEYRALFHSHPVAMAVWDPATGRLLALNDAAAKQYGYSADEAVGLPIRSIVHPDDWERLTERLARVTPGIVGGETFRHVRKDGAVIEVEITGHELHWQGRPARLVMALDVTERRRLEDRLREAERLESMGRLAGGIAHDFNNLLQVINGYSALLRDATPDDDPRSEDVEQIRRAGQRAAALVAQLLAFGRRQPLRPTRVDVGELVTQLEPLLRATLGDDIALEVRHEGQDLAVVADASRLEQVVVNLALNARDAMPAGGTLSIRARRCAAPANDERPDATGANDWVELAVRDSGEGMGPDVLGRVFEPFFTTKAPGRGTGLGLASAYGTIRQSGGRIDVASEPGHGALFTILLPAAAGPASADPGRAAV